MSDAENSIAGESVHGDRERDQMEISNTDQLSLINTSIDIVVKKQTENSMQYIDSRLSQAPQSTTLKVDDFSSKGVQFMFNSERSEILKCIENRNLGSAEQIIWTNQKTVIFKMIYIIDC